LARAAEVFSAREGGKKPDMCILEESDGSCPSGSVDGSLTEEK
jgi:hypothetical protein